MYLFFKMAKYEFEVTVHYGLWAKCSQLWPLNKKIGRYIMVEDELVWINVTYRIYEYGFQVQNISGSKK